MRCPDWTQGTNRKLVVVRFWDGLEDYYQDLLRNYFQWILTSNIAIIFISPHLCRQRELKLIDAAFPISCKVSFLMQNLIQGKHCKGGICHCSSHLLFSICFKRTCAQVYFHFAGNSIPLHLHTVFSAVLCKQLSTMPQCNARITINLHTFSFCFLKFHRTWIFAFEFFVWLENIKSMHC